MAGMDTSVIAILAVIAMMAGFFDAIAGGGGLITLPALLLTGIDPISAMATNKFQGASATVSATVAYAKKGLIEWRSGLPMAFMAFSGGCAGALSVSFVPQSTLEFLVPILLVLVAIYFALAPKIDNHEKKAKLPVFVFSSLIIPMLGFYDGVFGPGTGSFLMMAFVLLAGQGILRAISSTKLMNAASNLGALLIFALKGAIILPAALAMASGAYVGAQLGARCAVRFGSHLIKPLLIVICCVMASKLLLNPENPLRTYVVASLFR